MLRLQTSLLDLVLDVGSRRCSLRLDLPADDYKFPIQQLGPPFSLLRLLHDAKDLPLLFQLERDGESHPLGTLGSRVHLNPPLLRLTRWACAISALARDLDADLNVGFSLRDIDDRGPMAEFILAARGKVQRAVLVDTIIPEGALAPETPATIITNPTFRIGSLVYAEVVTFSGCAHILSTVSGNSRIRVQSSHPRSLQSFQLSDNQARTFAWDEALAQAAAALEAEGCRNVIRAPWHTIVDP